MALNIDVSTPLRRDKSRAQPCDQEPIGKRVSVIFSVACTVSGVGMLVHNNVISSRLFLSPRVRHSVSIGPKYCTSTRDIVHYP